ncbi:MAG: hypothetical protein QNJ63_08715 [Calothrix sp. MO_192.B10]|nr:hypothetical protein [Calothrix sp. MO_192.B10]
MESEVIAPAELLEALGSLTWRCLIETHTAGFSLQPWVREYVIEQFAPRYGKVVCTA